MTARGPWNYGLDVRDLQEPFTSVQVIENNWPGDERAFQAESPPMVLHCALHRVPGWEADHLGLVGLLQPSPAMSKESVEQVTLVPMGCARLRITQFPTVSDAPDAHEWTAPPKPKEPIPASASHCWKEDTLTALSDGLEPQDSNDYNVPRFTWWPQRGTREWVQYDFERPRKVSKVAVYWFDDSGRGRCRTPASWRPLYMPSGPVKDAEWREVKLTDGGSGRTAIFGTERDLYNVAAFEPVETKALRLEVQLRPDFSAGILEWRVE